MSAKEATARIKINKLLDGAGWCFFPDGDTPANIRLEPSVTIETSDLDALGDKLKKTTRGYIEADQAQVAPNRPLIERFEKKIQTTLAHVWGTDAEDAELDDAPNVVDGAIF